jgi:hypothetical protein
MSTSSGQAEDDALADALPTPGHDGGLVFQ